MTSTASAPKPVHLRDARRFDRLTAGTRWNDGAAKETYI